MPGDYFSFFWTRVIKEDAATTGAASQTILTQYVAHTEDFHPVSSGKFQNQYQFVREGNW